MMAVKKDLRDKIDSLEQIDNEKQKIEDEDNIQSERDFFREEAIRLNNICRELSIANKDLIRDNRFKATEMKHLMKKWKESEATNRHLLSELEKNLKFIKNLENDKKQFHSKQANIYINSKIVIISNHFVTY